MHLGEGAKWELRASLSDDLLRLVDKGAVQGIDIHFSPTLLPRLREEEERLLRKWFARMANGNGEIVLSFFEYYLNVKNSHTYVDNGFQCRWKIAI